MNRFKQLLIPANGSLESLRDGLRWGLDEHCLMVVLKVFPKFEGELNLTGVKNIGQVISSHRDRELAAIKGVIEQEGALARVIVREGDWEQAIKQVAVAEGSDLVLLTAKRRHQWLGRLGKGHLTQRLIDRAPCAVLVAKT